LGRSKKDAGLLLKAVPTLNMLLHDDSPAVKKRAVLANTNLYQPVLKEVASPKPKVRAPEVSLLDRCQTWLACPADPSTPGTPRSSIHPASIQHPSSIQ